MKYARKLWIPLAVLALTACAKAERDEVESDYPESNVETSETTAGVILGQFKKDATDDQVMVGSASSENKETYLEVPPGSIAIDTQISMQDGANDTPNALSSALELGDTAVLGGTTPVLLEATGVSETTTPFTLNIPIPLSTTTSSQLALADGTSKVAIEYLVKASAGNKVGLYVLGEDDLLGTIVAYKGAKFGWFRIVLLSKAAASVEKSTESDPPKKK